MFWTEFLRLKRELDFSKNTFIDDFRAKVNRRLTALLVLEINPCIVQELANKCIGYKRNLQCLDKKHEAVCKKANPSLRYYN